MIQLKVDELLKDRNKSQYWLSKQTGISPNNIGNICKGETSNIRLETIEKLCLALNCSPNDLMKSDNKQVDDIINQTTSFQDDMSRADIDFIMLTAMEKFDSILTQYSDHCRNRSITIMRCILDIQSSIRDLELEIR